LERLTEVGGAITILNNMSSSMGRMTSHIKNGNLWKIIQMFETTKQIMEPLSTLKTLTTRPMAFHLFQDN
jgi:hypothetical protein